MNAERVPQAPAADRLIDDNEGEYEFTVKHMRRLEDDLWYILNEKFEEIGPRGS